jgi:hypothetical protein
MDMDMDRRDGRGRGTPHATPGAQATEQKATHPSMGLFSSQKILQNFSDFSSHRIFRHMYEALNIDKK